MPRQRRVRLRDLVANANARVNQAGATMAQASGTLMGLDDLLLEVKDGVTFRIVRVGENSIMDFVMGKCDELPIQIKLDIEE